MTNRKTMTKIISVFLAVITCVCSFAFAAAAAYATGSYTVAASNGVNVRSGAGTGYSKVGAAAKGVTFSVTKVNGSWGYTSKIKCTNGYKSGWVALDYCTKNASSASSAYSTGTYAVASSNGVNVRSGAGTNYSKVGAAAKGVTFSVTKVNGSWGYTSGIQCTNGKKSGWVVLDYCEKKSSKGNAAPATEAAAAQTYSLSSKDSKGYRTLTVNGVSLTEYKVGSKYTSSRYAKIGNSSVDMAAWQCMGYARYVQYKLYGAHWACAKAKFPNLKGSEKVYPNADGYKNLITKAGVGAHIRTTEKSGVVPHSMIVIGITSTGFTVTDANADGANTIRVKTYTWSEYANSTFGKRGLQYIEIYAG